VFTQGLLNSGKWQRRLWEHTIRDDADDSRHVDCSHCNPIRHGLVASPVAWPHSSLHRFIRQGILAADWGDADSNDGEFGKPRAMIS
jgi:putative transposase